MKAEDFVAAAKRKTTKTQKQQACDWLREQLAGGKRLVTELTAQGEFTERVLQLAAAALGVTKTRRGGKHGPFEWGLPTRRKFEEGGSTR